jgi:hypothetical protein
MLYRKQLVSRPVGALAALAFGLISTVAVTYFYLEIIDRSLESAIQDTLKYNIGDVGYGGLVLNRSTVLTFWFDRQGLHDPISAVLGNGLGAASDSTDGYISTRYRGFGIGLTAASMLLWEQGVVGFLLFISILALAWRSTNRLLSDAAPPSVRADGAAIQAALSIFFVYVFYRVTLLESLPFQIVFASVLGYLAWLCRQYGDSAAAERRRR